MMKNGKNILMRSRDILLIRVPFSDLSNSKIRPVLALITYLDDDFLCCPITSNIFSEGIILSNADLYAGKLRFDSVVKYNKLFTLNKNQVIKNISILNKMKTKEIMLKITDIFNNYN